MSICPQSIELDLIVRYFNKKKKQKKKRSGCILSVLPRNYVYICKYMNDAGVDVILSVIKQ